MLPANELSGELADKFEKRSHTGNGQSCVILSLGHSVMQ